MRCTASGTRFAQPVSVTGTTLPSDAHPVADDAVLPRVQDKMRVGPRNRSANVCFEVFL